MSLKEGTHKKSEIQKSLLGRLVSRFKEDDSESYRSCELCGKHFKVENRWVLFCPDCKLNNKRYHFSEWLVEQSLTE